MFTTLRVDFSTVQGFAFRNDVLGFYLWPFVLPPLSFCIAKTAMERLCELKNEFDVLKIKAEPLLQTETPAVRKLSAGVDKFTTSVEEVEKLDRLYDQKSANQECFLMIQD